MTRLELDTARLLPKLRTRPRAHILHACLICSRRTNGRYCDDHQPDTPHARPYDDPTYQLNRAIVLAEVKVCAICDHPPTEEDPLTADHIVPNGDNHLANLRAVHRSCNSARGATPISRGRGA